MSTTAIILAAGRGTRMESDLPKVLHEVCGRPMLAYVFDAARAAGCDRLLTVVGHEAELVQQTFADDADDIDWVLQSPQLGTGHAVMVCKEHLAKLSGAVLVLAGDGPLIRSETLRQLLVTHRRQRAAVTLATSVLPDPRRYGRILRGESGELEGIVEYLDADEGQRRIREVNVSLYCFDAAALRDVIGELRNDNAKGEYYLTDALGLLRRRGARLSAIAAVPPEDVFSINTAEELAHVAEIMATRIKEDRANA
jgi:bifunctional UDP-N-acetylglucosamine pyrophosphorylase/glucosamine-1-phosphate N-acetyltransferase